MLELLGQLVVQVVVEILGDLLLDAGFRGAAGLVRSDVWRRLTEAAIGVAAGLLWGDHLTGGAHWPRLLWVSLGLAAATFVLAVGRPTGRTPRRSDLTWRTALQPPWRWSTDRLLDISLLNIGAAAGIAVAFRPGG